MAYEGPLLAASVVRALSSIPGAIRDIKALLSGKEINGKEVLSKMEMLQKALVDFCKTEAWLREIKEIHQILQVIDTQLEKARAEHIKAVSSGQFNQQAYQMSVIQEVWYWAKLNSLTKLISKAQSIEHVEPEPLVLDKDGKPSGPAWACRFIVLGQEIDKALDAYDNGVSRDTKKISETMNSLIQHVKIQMYLADERMREEAEKFGNELYKLSGILEQI